MKQSGKSACSYTIRDSVVEREERQTIVVWLLLLISCGAVTFGLWLLPN